MPIPLVVPDASVVLKWVLPSDDEPDAEKALLLREAILNETVKAILPGLWLYEVGNTVARRFPEQAAAWLSALMKFGFEESLPSPRWLAKTLELTDRYQVSFYDATYHALALIHNGQFVTADARYIARVSESVGIVALGEWDSPRPPPKRRGSGRS